MNSRLTGEIFSPSDVRGPRCRSSVPPKCKIEILEGSDFENSNYHNTIAQACKRSRQSADDGISADWPKRFKKSGRPLVPPDSKPAEEALRGQGDVRGRTSSKNGNVFPAMYSFEYDIPSTKKSAKDDFGSRMPRFHNSPGSTDVPTGRSSHLDNDPESPIQASPDSGLCSSFNTVDPFSMSSSRFLWDDLQQETLRVDGGDDFHPTSSMNIPFSNRDFPSICGSREVHSYDHGSANPPVQDGRGILSNSFRNNSSGEGMPRKSGMFLEGVAGRRNPSVGDGMQQPPPQLSDGLLSETSIFGSRERGSNGGPLLGGAGSEDPAALMASFGMLDVLMGEAAKKGKSSECLPPSSRDSSEFPLCQPGFCLPRQGCPPSSTGSPFRESERKSRLEFDSCVRGASVAAVSDLLTDALCFCEMDKAEHESNAGNPGSRRRHQQKPFVPVGIEHAHGSVRKKKSSSRNSGGQTGSDRRQKASLSSASSTHSLSSSPSRGASSSSSCGKLYSSSLSRFTLPDENGKRKIRSDIMSIAEQLPALPGLYFDKKQKGFRVRFQNVYVGWVALSRFQSIEEAYISAREIWENAKLHAEKFQTPHAAIMASFPLQKEAKAAGKNRGGRPRTVTQLPENPQDWMTAAYAAHRAMPPAPSTPWAAPLSLVQPHLTHSTENQSSVGNRDVCDFLNGFAQSEAPQFGNNHSQSDMMPLTDLGGSLFASHALFSAGKFDDRDWQTSNASGGRNISAARPPSRDPFPGGGPAEEQNANPENGPLDVVSLWELSRGVPFFSEQDGLAADKLRFSSTSSGLGWLSETFDGAKTQISSDIAAPEAVSKSIRRPGDRDECLQTFEGVSHAELQLPFVPDSLKFDACSKQRERAATLEGVAAVMDPLNCSYACRPRSGAPSISIAPTPTRSSGAGQTQPQAISLRVLTSRCVDQSGEAQNQLGGNPFLFCKSESFDKLNSPGPQDPLERDFREGNGSKFAGLKLEADPSFSSARAKSITHCLHRSKEAGSVGHTSLDPASDVKRPNPTRPQLNSTFSPAGIREFVNQESKKDSRPCSLASIPSSSCGGQNADATRRSLLGKKRSSAAQNIPPYVRGVPFPYFGFRPGGTSASDGIDVDSWSASNVIYPRGHREVSVPSPPRSPRFELPAISESEPGYIAWGDSHLLRSLGHSASENFANDFGK